METFPQYFLKDGRCIRRESPTTGIEVQIPAAGKNLPLICTPVTYPTRERMDAALIEMEIADQDIYEQFIITLCQQAAHFRVLLTQVREARRTGGQLHISSNATL